jgi:hypothetical protein
VSFATFTAWATTQVRVTQLLGPETVPQKQRGRAEPVPRQTGKSFQELASAAFADILKKHDQPVGFKAALEASVTSRSKVKRAPTNKSPASGGASLGENKCNAATLADSLSYKVSNLAPRFVDGNSILGIRLQKFPEQLSCSGSQFRAVSITSILDKFRTKALKTLKNPQ